VTHSKPSDRGVIRDLIGGDHTESDILAQTPLDTTRGALPDRVGIEQQRDHHLRIECHATPPINAIRVIDGAQIDLFDSVQHKPRQMVLRQPLAQAGRQQQFLLTIALQEILRHRPPPLGDQHIVLNHPDDTPTKPGFTQQPQTSHFRRFCNGFATALPRRSRGLRLPRPDVCHAEQMYSAAFGCYRIQTCSKADDQTITRSKTVAGS
jgi:hypothetical protein